MAAISGSPARLRVQYAKTGALRYTGHLDLHRLWERTLRRAGLPLAYTQGFHPQPRINQACALPLGFTSRAEVIDIWLEHILPLKEIAVAINRAVPSGIEVNHIQEVDLKTPPIQTQVLSAEYHVTLLDTVNVNLLEVRIQEILNAETLPRDRRGKNYDLRPLIEDLHLIDPSDEHGAHNLSMLLSAREGATGRPDEVLEALGIPSNSTRIERTKLIFQNSTL